MRIQNGLTEKQIDSDNFFRINQNIKQLRKSRIKINRFCYVLYIGLLLPISTNI